MSTTCGDDVCDMRRAWRRCGLRSGHRRVRCAATWISRVVASWPPSTSVPFRSSSPKRSGLRRAMACPASQRSTGGDRACDSVTSDNAHYVSSDGKPRRRHRPGTSPCAVPGRACTTSPRVDVSADVMSEGFSLEEALTWRGGASLFARGAARDPDRRPVHGKVRPGSREIGIPLLRSPRSDARGARAAAGHPKTRCGETVEPVRMLGCVRTGSTASRR